MPRVLILEDEKVVARDLQRILGDIGYETSLASSGEEAIEVAERDHPDLALVDIHLAGTLDGIDTAQTLRQRLDLAVVYLTAYADEQTLERAKATTPSGYLVKPFDETTLSATVRMAVHKSGIERCNRIEQQRQTGFLDHLTVGLITADTSGCVKMINACGRVLTGWSEQEALDTDLTQVLRLCNAKQVSVTGDLLQAALCGKKGQAVGTLKVVSKSGGETEVELKVSAIQDDRQQTVGVCLVFWPTGAPERESGPPSPRTSELDPVTGLPGRANAMEVLVALRQKPASHLFAAVFVLDGYSVTAQKFGARVADDVLTYYCIFLAQKLHEDLGAKKLFRWTGPCLLAILGPQDSVQTAQRDIARCTHVTLERIIDLPSRMLLLPISGSAAVFPIDDMSTEELVSEIDSFVATQGKGSPTITSQPKGPSPTVK